jgi:hypothetical protein
LLDWSSDQRIFFLYCTFFFSFFKCSIDL